MASTPASTGARREVPPPFGRIVCGTDGSRSARLAVEQAIALSGPATALVFVCVREAGGVGATRRATITAERADQVLPFPERPLVATDGSRDARRAVELAARIGRRHRFARRPKRIAVDAVDLTAELGVEPTVIRAHGHPADVILDTAAREGVSLAVLGSRGLSGIRALGSVSERVAHRARCSVLVARPG
ncbi:MAG TPA: universal stress protein [Thermoleophilaceae bacterium]|jgi:nucleotide-binding universal stress UspA family protein|nr:universal stress protein [Thermoleophilaceae bacterium]